MNVRSPSCPGEPGRQRRHRPDGVLRQQAHDRLHVAALHRVHVAIDQLAQLLVVERAQRRLLALVGQLLVDGLACALERAVHRRDAGVERLRDLGGREAEHLAQDQHRSLVGGQVLERRDERQLHALAQLVARRAPRSRPPVPARRPGTARPRPTRAAAGRDRRAGRRCRRSRSAAPAWAAARSGSGRCWWRSCTATSAASCVPRTWAGRARRAASPPGARLGVVSGRACGSSAQLERNGSTSRANAWSSPLRAASRRAGSAVGLVR